MTPANLNHSIQDLFSRVVESFPHKAALATEDRSVSYSELDNWSERIAEFLHSKGVGSGDLVGLYVQRSPQAVAAMLGVLKCGAAYVPFDSTYPAVLLNFVYDDSRPKLMLADRTLLTSASAPRWNDIAFDIEDASAGSANFSARRPPIVDSEALAYVMYTSGSTGRPKGVLIPHRGVVRLVRNNPYADLSEREVILHFAPVAFDASTFEIWGALLNGGTLAIPAAPKPSLDDIAAAIAAFRATTLWLTAGLFHLMVDHRLEGLRPLRQLLAGGDVLSPQRVEKLLRELPDCRLINGYGPTENTTFTCCYTVPRGASIGGSIPIGVPISNTTVFIFDDQRQPVADGEAGELYAGGMGLGLGYLNRPELTAEKFVAHPQNPQMRVYRTGDRVRRRSDGNLEFLGRADRQVKVSGKRVELDEIEACLRRCPSVCDAAVIASASGSGEQARIFAFVNSVGNPPVRESQLREWVKRELPDFMIPNAITLVDGFALTPVGKIDRAQLKPPAIDFSSSATVAPRNEIESRLLAIWKRVLARESVGVNDNFFDLGGTSLQLLAVLATIQDAMKTDLTIVDLFEHPRISALATRVTTGARISPSGMSAIDRAQRQRTALALGRTRLRGVS